MEIIFHGSTYHSRICDNCKCVFAFTEKDIKKSVDMDWIICPECGNQIDLEIETEEKQ